MERQQWQYQIKAEPVTVPTEEAETVTVDKWFVQSPDPLFPLPFPQSQVTTDIIIDIPLDRWFVEAPVPQKLISYLHVFTPPTVDILLEIVTLDKWYIQNSDIIRQRFPQELVDSVSPEPLLEIVTLDKWFLQYPEITKIIYPQYTVSDFLSQPPPSVIEEAQDVRLQFRRIVHRHRGRMTL